MKLLLIFALIGIAFAKFNSIEEFKQKNVNKSVTEYAIEIGYKTFEHEFNKFKVDYNRVYESAEEEEKRKLIFLNTLEFIEKHNELYRKGEATHHVGVTLFADRTSEEYTQTFSMPPPIKINFTQFEASPKVPIASAPASFDWRQQGKVTGVKNQGQCGSCWAFATVATIESGYRIRHNQAVDLSEQQLVDCMNTNCGGQYINVALDYVRAHGVEQQAEYPYHARAGQCQDNGGRFHARISGYQTMGRAAGRNPASDEEIKAGIVSHGPLALMFDAYGDDFAHYRGGVLSTGATLWKAVHAVTVVGYTPDHWIIKNSWGTGWGEGGYLNLARGRDLRGVNDYLYWPTF